MSYVIREWLNIAFRWTHVFAAIMWIGQTWFFTWLDRRFHQGEKQVWMVHSGGFYIVDKQKGPELREGQTLHWFKWEAALTWISGIVLYVLVYYYGGLMTDSPEQRAKAIAISVGSLIVSWIVYDLLWITIFARYEWFGIVASYLMLVGSIYFYTRVFTGRAAYLQTGAGIVSDSDPASEYQECINKANAMLEAIGRASLRGGVEEKRVREAIVAAAQ